MNIEDYLDVDYELSGIDPEEREIRLQTKIVEIEKNPFYLPITGDKRVRHFRLEIYPERRWVELEEGEDTDWHKITNTHDMEVTPLYFHMSTYGVPDIAKFSQHVYDECFAALFALYKPDKYNSIFKFYGSEDISMEDVWVYLKLQNKDYSQTTRFIKDYWYWHDRLYQTQKWFHYLLGDIGEKTACDRREYPIGWKALEMISPNMHPTRIDEIRKNLCM